MKWAITLLPGRTIVPTLKGSENGSDELGQAKKLRGIVVRGEAVLLKAKPLR